MATFGQTSIAGTSRSNLGGNVEQVFGPFNLPVDATVTLMSIYLDGLGPGVGAQLLKPLIYADASNPTTLKVTGTEISVADNAAAQWFDSVTSVSLTAGNYWLGWHGGLVDVGSAFFQAAGTRQTRNRVYASGALDPFGASDFSDGQGASIYATYVTGTAINTLKTLGRTKGYNVYEYPDAQQNDGSTGEFLLYSPFGRVVQSKMTLAAATTYLNGLTNYP